MKQQESGRKCHGLGGDQEKGAPILVADETLQRPSKVDQLTTPTKSPNSRELDSKIRGSQMRWNSGYKAKIRHNLARTREGESEREELQEEVEGCGK